MAGINHPLREARARAAERFAAIADQLDLLPPQESDRLLAGLTHWSIQAGEALIEAIDDGAIAVLPASKPQIQVDKLRNRADLRNEHEQRLPEFARPKRGESTEWIGDWRVRWLGLYAAHYLGIAELTYFSNCGMSEDESRFTIGERVRALVKVCRRLAKELGEHPALSLLRSLTDMRTETANGHLFRDVALRRAEARRLQQNLLGCLGHEADQRANARARQGAALAEVFGEYHELHKAVSDPPPSNEPADLARSLRRVARRAHLCCESCRIALRAGGGEALDAVLASNADGQPRSVELHTKLQEMQKVCLRLEVDLSDPGFVIDDAAEQFTTLGAWFGEQRDELGAVLETRGLEPQNTGAKPGRRRSISGAKAKTGRPPLDAKERQRRRDFADEWRRDSADDREFKDTCAAFEISVRQGKTWLEWVRTHPPEK